MSAHNQAALDPTFVMQENVLLAAYTTFRIGGPARYFCAVRSEATLVEALHFARQRSLAVFVLGGGSNLLVSDSGFDGLVLHAVLDVEVEVRVGADATYLRAPAGLDWDRFVLQVCELGLCGVECLGGIPGLVGGTPVQNVGAYGQEVADTICAVRVLDRETLAFTELTRAECQFAYRSSIFNASRRGRYIVTAVEFRLDRSARPNLSYADLKAYFGASATPSPLEVYHAVRAIRHRKGMLLVDGEQDCRSAGSFFKNPVVAAELLDQIAATVGVEIASIPHWAAGEGRIKLPAAWLLERAGFTKGFRLGEAGISSRHTLALINRGAARAEDIAALRDRIMAEVERRFQVRLEQEPVLVG